MKRMLTCVLALALLFSLAAVYAEDDDCCHRRRDTDGVEFVDCCKRHVPLIEREMDLNEFGATAEEINGLADDWEEDLSSLYEAWMRQAGSDGQAAVNAARTAFFAALDARQAALERECDAAVVAEFRLQTLREEGMRLCEVLGQ